jgi:hypothetical protein
MSQIGKTRRRIQRPIPEVPSVKPKPQPAAPKKDEPGIAVPNWPAPVKVPVTVPATK